MKKKILVADDDPAILDVMSLMLEDAGYLVQLCEDGEKVYQMTGEYPDLLILDIWMSGTNGRDVCRYIKSQKRLRTIPVIMFSANREGARIAHEAGAEDFIAKPFDMNDLLSKIESMIYNKAP
jgi:DNA-binding response OmpR family regulator